MIVGTNNRPGSQWLSSLFLRFFLLPLERSKACARSGASAPDTMRAVVRLPLVLLHRFRIANPFSVVSYHKLVLCMEGDTLHA